MLKILKELLPKIDSIALQDITKENDNLLVQLVATKSSCPCPICNNYSHRIHSLYDRSLADLPWSNFAVQIKLRSRKFFCDNDDCVRKIFTERFKEDLPPYARRTTRLKNILQEIGFATGGNAGSLLSKKLGINANPSTLLV